MNSLLSKSFPVSERVERLSNLLRQNIIYDMSNGKSKVTKHVQLAITTKRKTGSRLMLDSVNCHSISYDKVHNFKTSFSRLNVKNLSNQSFVPNNVQPSSFATFFCQKRFLVHLSITQMASLSSFQAKLKNQSNHLMSRHLNFVQEEHPSNQS